MYSHFRSALRCNPNMRQATVACIQCRLGGGHSQVRGYFLQVEPQPAL